MPPYTCNNDGYKNERLAGEEVTTRSVGHVTLTPDRYCAAQEAVRNFRDIACAIAAALVILLCHMPTLLQGCRKKSNIRGGGKYSKSNIRVSR